MGLTVRVTIIVSNNVSVSKNEADVLTGRWRRGMVYFLYCTVFSTYV